MARSSGYCRAPGCAQLCLPSTHSPYCSAHRHAVNRWGHPLQTSIKVPELAPFRKQVAASLKRNPDSKVWEILGQRWARIVAYAEGVEATRQLGVATSRYEAQAASIIVSAARAVPPDVVMTEVFALYMLQASRPRRFMDDRSFRFALAHRVRRLAPLSASSYYCTTRKKSKTVYRDVALRVMEYLGMWTAGAFGASALQFIDSERTRLDRPRQESQQLAKAIASLS